MEKEETHNLDATKENQDKSNDTENISNEEIKFSKILIFWALKSEDSDVPKVMIGLDLMCLIILLLFLSSLQIHRKP